MTKDQQIEALQQRINTQELLINEIKKNEIKLSAHVDTLRVDNSRLQLEARWLRDNFSKLLEAITT